MMNLSAPIDLPSISATEELAAIIAPLLRTGDCLALQGHLGAGKTAFARALLQKLGVRCDIPSPTFTLLQSYETTVGEVFHFDLYRLKNEAELEELGWFEVLSHGVVIVEWPEKAGSHLPKEALKMLFELGVDGKRKVLLDAAGDWAKRLKGMVNDT